jgi:hypothetical protein
MGWVSLASRACSKGYLNVWNVTDSQIICLLEQFCCLFDNNIVNLVLAFKFIYISSDEKNINVFQQNTLWCFKVFQMFIMEQGN